MGNKFIKHKSHGGKKRKKVTPRQLFKEGQNWSQENLSALVKALIADGYLPKKWAGNQARILEAWAKYRNRRRGGEIPQMDWRQWLNKDLPGRGGGGGRGGRGGRGGGGGRGGRGGGGGGGGGGAAPTYGIGELESSTPQDLKDRLVKYYEAWTGTIPDAPSLQWVTNKALGNKSAYDIRTDIMATPEFKTRYPVMPAGMDIREYDKATIGAHAFAFKTAGRRAKKEELAMMFAGDSSGFYNSISGGG